MNKNKGFTLIEVLLYTVIFAIVGSLTTGILLTVTQVQQRESASAEVTGQLNFVMQRIQYLVRESSNIEIAAGVTTSTLKLRMKDSSKDPTCLSLVNGVIQLAEGPADPQNPINCTTNTSDLTSDRVTVNKLEFKKFIYYPGHDTVSLNIQMTYNSQNPKSQVQRTLSSAIARVSAATFDSDVVPGSSYTYSLGQSGAPWQNIYMKDGSVASPSYSFGADTNTGIFRPGADILGFTTNSTERMRIDASGNVGIATTTPSYTLDVTGTFRTSATSTFSGNVGIGTTTPATKLEVGGRVRMTEFQLGTSATSSYVLTADVSGVGTWQAVSIDLPFNTIPYKNLVIKNNVTNPNYQVDVDADEIIVEGVRKTSLDLTIDITVSGANGLDTGGEAVSTWYHIWVIYNPTTATFAGLLSKSATTPTMPAGYTKKRYVGAIFNDSSSNFIPIFQKNNLVVIPPYTALSNGVQGSYTAVNFPSIVPPTAIAISGTVWIERAAQQAVAYIASDNQGLGRLDFYIRTTTNADTAPFMSNLASPFRLTLKESQTIYYKTDWGNNYTTILISGWEY